METNRQETYVLSLAGGTLSRARCKRCGSSSVAWVQSKKTGKWYLCELVTSGSSKAMARTGDWHGERAVPWMPHKCQTRGVETE